MGKTELRLLILFVCTAGSLLILQNAFDRSDHRKAELAVKSEVAHGQRFGDFLEKRSPGGVWSTEITHGCRGIVHTVYDAPGGRYEFDYDDSLKSYSTSNEMARAAHAEFMGAAPAPPATP